MGTTTPIKNKEKLEKFRNYYKDIEYKPRNYALIVLGLNSALRIGDIIVLQWKEVYNSKKGAYQEHLAVTEQKTGKKNILALNTSSIEALEFYRTSLPSFDENHCIFSSQKQPGNGISRSQAFRIIKKAAICCGLDDSISCHSLRKTFGYYAWQNGTPPALLMSIYNHSSYSITKKYLCIDQNEKDEVFLNTFL